MSKLPVKCPGCGGHALFVSPDEVRMLIAVLEGALAGPGPKVVREVA